MVTVGRKQGLQPVSYNDDLDAKPELFSNAAPRSDEQGEVTVASCDVLSTDEQVDELMNATSKGPSLTSAAVLTPKGKQTYRLRNSSIRSNQDAELGDTVKTLNLPGMAAQEFSMFENQSPSGKTPQTA